MPHFFATDLVGVALAFLLGIPLILLPGYGIGWTLNLFEFRALPANTRLSLSTVIGLSLVPILLFIPFRFASARATWVAVALLIMLGILSCARSRWSLQAWSISRRTQIASLVWVILCLGLMLDLTVDSRLYPSTVFVDTSFRSQVISALADATHLPPSSFFYSPGHPETLRYHYIYFLIPALTVKVGHGLIPASMALVGLSLWTGLALLCVVSAVIRLFWTFPDHERATTIASVLLGVGGLDLLFSGSEILLRALHGQFIFTGPDAGLWNGFGSAFTWLSTALWSPHHLGGLTAGVLGCLLLWHSRDMSGWRRWTHAVAAGAAFATLGGTSVYVEGIFFIFLILVAVELLLNAPRYLPPLVLAGVLAVLLVAQFLFDVKPPTSADAPAFFHFQIRPFLPVTLLFSALNIHSSLAWNLTYLAALPLTYLFEFGIFFLGGVWWLYKRREHPPELIFRDHMIIGLGAISLIVPSLAWSGMEISNDLGYRGVLPAQFLLLFCAVELVDRYLRKPTPNLGTNRLMQLAVLFMVIGVGTNLLEVLILRGGIGSTARDTILVGEMFRPDTSAERLHELRQAYTWIRANTPKTTVIQENPITWQMASLGQYSDRRTALYGSNPSYMVGENHAEYMAELQQIKMLFASQTSVESVQPVCSRFKIDYLIVQSGDGAWGNRESYVWRKSAVFETPMVRVIPCEH
jgi:hypothetical protein